MKRAIQLFLSHFHSSFMFLSAVGFIATSLYDHAQHTRLASQKHLHRHKI